MVNIVSNYPDMNSENEPPEELNKWAERVGGFCCVAFGVFFVAVAERLSLQVLAGAGVALGGVMLWKGFR
jgi:hypothetical protein